MKPAVDHSAQDLLRATRELLSRSDAGLQGVWPRAAAHLCRQALEAGLAEFWAKQLPGLEKTPLRTQLFCLPLYMTDKELARAAGYAWAALSNACHHHVYELAPTASELAAWADTVEAMLRET